MAERRYNPQKLVIFDYSGTLSIEAPAFGRPENLVRALAESGLAACGVATPAIFWEGIVFPTWEAAGRTGVGFARSMADRIVELGLPASAKNAPPCPEQSPLPSTGNGAPASITEAAERFVSMYLAHSRPEPLWGPFLAMLLENDRFCVMIATDHYAEATTAIVRYLRDWEMPAEPLKNGTGSTGEKRPFLVANSADLGFWKAERPFWEIVRKRLPYNFHSVVLIDDFGFNEADVSGYGMLSRVRKRRIDTKSVLEDVFQTGVSALPFLLPGGDTYRQDTLRDRILKILKKVT